MSLEGIKLTQQLEDAIEKEKSAIALSKQAFELRTNNETSVEYSTTENNEIFAKFLTSHKTFIATLDELVKKFEQGVASILQDNAELRDDVKRLQKEKQILRDSLKSANAHLKLTSTQLQEIEGLSQQLNKVNLDVCWHDIIREKLSAIVSQTNVVSKVGQNAFTIQIEDEYTSVVFCKGLIKTSVAAKTLATELCEKIGLDEEDAKQHTYHRNQKSLKMRFDNDRLAYCLIPNTSERPAPITFQYGQHPTDAPQSATLALTIEEFEKVQSKLKSNKTIGQ